MFYFILGMSLMLNLVFIIGLIKCYKKIFKGSKVNLLDDIQSQLNMAFTDLNNKKIKENKKFDEKDNDSLGSIFKSGSDFWD